MFRVAQHIHNVPTKKATGQMARQRSTRSVHEGNLSGQDDVHSFNFTLTCCTWSVCDLQITRLRKKPRWSTFQQVLPVYIFAQ